MKILVRDLWRKCGKGLNIFSHWDELCSLDNYLWRPIGALAAGAALALAGEYFGLWALAAHHLNPFVPVHLLNTDITWLAYVFLPVLPITLLGQEMFMARSRSSKANDAWWVYLYRYVKAMFVLYGASLVSVLLGTVGISFIVQKIQELMQLPKTPQEMALIAGFGALGASSVVLMCVCVILICIAVTYGFAFIMQGKSIVEAVRKGYKLFKAHWMYTGALMGLQFGLTAALEYAGTYLHARFSYPFIMHGMHFAITIVFLLYWALLFSYHKRISKVPTTR